MPTLIDTHCHLTFGDLAGQADQVMRRAREAGVSPIITIATNVAEIRDSLGLLERFEDMYVVAGVHPHEASKFGEEDLAALSDLFSGRWDTPVGVERVVGVGETGLDYYYDFSPRAQQEQVFRAHLELACQVGRPIVIHAREAELDVCDILKDYPALAGRVVFHCFSPGVKVARRVLDMGNFLSLTGVVTFKNATATRESACYAPLERIMVETDAPFLSPEPVRNKKPNEPAFVVHTARFVADKRGESFDAFAAQTTANARDFFGLRGEPR